MSINSRTKGKAWETEIIGILQPMTDRRLFRNLEQVRGGGYDIVGAEPFALEIKRAKKLNLVKWWEQAVKQAGAKLIPVLLYRQDRMKWRAMRMKEGSLVDTPIEDFLVDFKKVLG